MQERISADVHLRQPVLTHLYESLGAQMFANYARLCIKAHADTRAASVALSLASAVSLSPSQPASNKKTVRVSFSERDSVALGVIAAVPKEKRGLFLEASMIGLAGLGVVSASYGFDSAPVPPFFPYSAPVLQAVPPASQSPAVPSRPAVPSEPAVQIEKQAEPEPQSIPTPLQSEPAKSQNKHKNTQDKALEPPVQEQPVDSPVFEVTPPSVDEGATSDEPSGEDILSMLEAMM